VGQTKVKQKNNYALKKGKYMFLGFTKGITYIKMRKPRKKILLISSWE
jgi:ribosomal protein L30E